jgi:4-hydroxy-3-polyprenylbenzoate decarboxylase
MFQSLQSFISALDREGSLLRISRELDPVLEIAELADQESKSKAPVQPSASARRVDPRWWDRGGRAVLCERVKGSDFPLLVNAFGSYRRMEMALGCHDGGRVPGGFDGIAQRIGSLTKPVPPRSLSELLAKGREVLPLLRIMPRLTTSAPCQDVVHTGDAVDLSWLPALRCWPLDGDLGAVGYPPDVNGEVPGLGHPDIPPDEWQARWRGRYITFAGIHTIHRDDLGQERPGSHNIGMYRVQLFGKTRLSMHWHMHHDGASHWRSWKRAGDRMPVAIVLGGETVLPYAATCPLPPGISELLMAGFLNGRGIPMVWAKTVPLRVPANAEIVIEGWVDTRSGFPGWDPRDPSSGALGEGAVFEGPFGDHTGFYSMPDRYPLVEVTAITHRRNAVYPTTIVGLPPQEDYYLGKATERVMGALLKVVVHDVEDYDLPMFGAFHNCAMLGIHKHYPLQARRLMASIWGTGQMAWTKCLFVVDQDEVDVHDAAAVLALAARRCRPERDIELTNGPLDILDHAAPRLGAGMKLGLDCTIKVAGEEVNGVAIDLPEATSGHAGEVAAHLDRVRALPGVRDARVQPEVPGWLLVSVDKGLEPGCTVTPDRVHLDQEVCAAVLALDPAADGCGPLPFVIVLGRDVDLDAPVDPFFHWLANMDPSRDLHWGEGRRRVGFACAPKGPDDARNGQPVRAWPPVVAMTPEVTAKVLEQRKPTGGR